MYELIAIWFFTIALLNLSTILIVKTRPICHKSDCKDFVLVDYHIPVIKPIQRPIRTNNVLLLTANQNNNKWSDTKMELSNYTDKDISNLSELEATILVDYFKGIEAIKHLQNGHSYLATQFDIKFETPKRTRKKSIVDQAQEVINHHDIADTLSYLTPGRNALGGANGHVINHIKFTPKTLERINQRFVDNWGIIPERKQLISTCPDCGGHYKTEFGYNDKKRIRDEQDSSRLIRESYTKFTCQSCGKTEKIAGNQGGKYLIESPIKESVTVS